jgi:hypothetical protein
MHVHRRRLNGDHPIGNLVDVRNRCDFVDVKRGNDCPRPHDDDGDASNNGSAF